MSEFKNILLARVEEGLAAVHARAAAAAGGQRTPGAAPPGVAALFEGELLQELVGLAPTGPHRHRPPRRPTSSFVVEEVGSLLVCG